MIAPLPWRTVLVDAQALLRELLARSLQADPRFSVIAQVEDPAQAREICARMCPDLVVIDVESPRVGSLDLVQYLTENRPRTRVLVLSQSQDACTVNWLHQTGVHGFVDKEQSLEILEEALVEVASGRK